jgi:hypothetical protein
MGIRDDDFVDDERADAALRRLLARSGQPAAVPPPPALVTQTMQLLPPEPPAVAARNAARRAAIRLALRLALLGALALVALLGVWSALGGGVHLALLFGDGTSGISRTLLSLELLAKPLLRTAGAAGALWLLMGLVALAGAGWLWLRLLRRTPVYYAERAT